MAIELHLIGYTADLTHLVLDVDPDSDRGHHRLVIDADLFLTLDEIREQLREAGVDVGDEAVEEDEDPIADDVPVVVQPTRFVDELLRADEDEEDEADEEDDEVGAANPFDRASGDDDAEQDEEEDEPAPATLVVGPGRQSSTLSPAQIQAMLRAGRSPRSVAEEAGTDLAWIERWLAPIAAERREIVRHAQVLRIRRPRLGTSSKSLGAAVERNLDERGVDPDDVTWSAKRRADGTWSVNVRYRSRGRTRSATWRYDREEETIEPTGKLATELGFVKRRRRSG